MTKEVALADAKNRLSALIDEVEKTGEAITITKHGRPAARLTSARIHAPEERKALIERILKRRDEQTDAHMTEPFDWRAAIDDGRA